MHPFIVCSFTCLIIFICGPLPLMTIWYIILYRIKKERFLFLSAQIGDLFKGEVKEAFYTPSSKGLNGPVTCRGYLYDTYRTIRKNLILIEEIQKDVTFRKRKRTEEGSQYSCTLTSYSTRMYILITNIFEICRRTWA